jgi:hypothetical protein
MYHNAPQVETVIAAPQTARKRQISKATANVQKLGKIIMEVIMMKSESFLDPKKLEAAHV